MSQFGHGELRSTNNATGGRPIVAPVVPGPISHWQRGNFNLVAGGHHCSIESVGNRDDDPTVAINPLRAWR